MQRKGVTKEVPQLVGEDIEKLRNIFPQVFAEGKIDFERLRQSLGQYIDDKPEKYSFSWAGKRNAINLLQMPTRATLVPVKDESVNFDTTENLFVAGDNLEVLKLLYKPYFGKIKMIYIDPPYNTGNDFVYPDNYADPLDTYLKISGQKTADGNMLTSNPETSGRYHSSWLSMIYPRLFLARQLLREDGLIFVSIDDKEAANLRLVMNEIFGEENFVACVSWEKRFTRSNNAKLFSSVKDTILVFRRSALVDILRESRTAKSDAIYANPDNDPRGPWTSVLYVNPATKQARPNLVYTIKNPHTGEIVQHPTNAWKYSPEQHEVHIKEKKLWWGKEGKNRYPRLKKFLSEVSDGVVPVDIWSYEDAGTTDEGTKELEALIGKDVFDNPKPTKLIRRMLSLATGSDGDIVLDFFAGSGTTADAVLQANREDGVNRRFIMVQLQEPTPDGSPAQRAGFKTIAEIGEERIRRVISKMNKTKQNHLDERQTEDLGFKVFKLTESNYKPWTGVEEKKPERYATEMQSHLDSLIKGWEEKNVIYEVAIKEGYPLNLKIKQEKRFHDNTVFCVVDGNDESKFWICLDDEIMKTTRRNLNLSRDDLFICRDIAVDDTAAANLALACRLKTI